MARSNVSSNFRSINNVAGGNARVAMALRELKLAGKVHVTVPLIREGIIDYLIAQDPASLLAKVAA